MSEEYQYEKNIKNIKEFLKTDSYKSLKNKNDIKSIKNIINAGYLENGKKIYIDPDNNDRLLYEKIYEDIKQNIRKKDVNKKYNIDIKKCRLCMNEIYLSLDCVIGWKAIIDVCIAESIELEKFLDVYKIIRNPKYAGHLIWPVHSLPTINMERFQQFNYTLFDIKNYFEKREELKALEVLEGLKVLNLKNAYFTNTLRWLNQFSDFKEFIDIMNLGRWCDDNYKVKDISKNDGTPIERYLGDKRTDYPITIDYINNMIEVISDGKEKFRLGKGKN